MPVNLVVPKCRYILRFRSADKTRGSEVPIILVVPKCRYIWVDVRVEVRVEVRVDEIIKIILIQIKIE